MFKKFITCALFAALAITGTHGMANAKDVIRLGIGDPIESGAGEFGKKFKELVEEQTAGKTKVELFPNCSLGDESEMLQNARRGSLDMAIVGIGNAVPLASGLAALTFPYLLENEKMVVNATTGKLFDYFNDVAIKTGGIRILGYVYTNYRHLTNSKREVKNMADIKGLKLRMPNNKVFIDTYEAWGANPVPMAWAETFTALQQGVVDGQDNPYVVNATMKFQEVQKYLTEIHYQYSLQPLFVGAKNFNSFPADLQKIVQDCAMEAQKHVHQWENANSEKARKVMEDAGVKVSVLEDEAEWKKAAIEKVWPTLYSFVGGKEVIDMIQEELNK